MAGVDSAAGEKLDTTAEDEFESVVADSSSSGSEDGGDDEGEEAQAAAAEGPESCGSNWMVSHPKFTEMMALDIADDTQVYAAFLVYLDLLEARNWHRLTYVGSVELQLIYLQGCEKEGQAPQVVCPAPVQLSFSQERIRKIMKYTCHQDDQHDAAVSFILAIVESDSTIVYYRLTDGFVTPDPPDVIEDIGSKQWRKRRRKLLR